MGQQEHCGLCKWSSWNSGQLGQLTLRHLCFTIDRNDFQRTLIFNLRFYAEGIWRARNLNDNDISQGVATQTQGTPQCAVSEPSSLSLQSGTITRSVLRQFDSNGPFPSPPCNREEHVVFYYKLITKEMLPIRLNYT